MRKLSLIVLSTGLGAASFAALAQDAAEVVTVETPPAMSMSEDQQLAYDSWPAEQRAQYDAWPADAQAYYWTLPPPRQDMFWRLSDNDKLALVAMDSEARMSAWEMIEQKMMTEAAPQ